MTCKLSSLSDVIQCISEIPDTFFLTRLVISFILLDLVPSNLCSNPSYCFIVFIVSTDLWQTISLLSSDFLAPLNISNTLHFTLLIISIISDTRVYKPNYVLV